MAASSSAATRVGPHVFISFRGEDVRNHFISYLDSALRRANINVFIDENQFLGTDLANLLTEIEESEIALVIFSKNYADSDRCLDELAKMNERRDQGRLIVIPVFYKLDPLVVKELRGEFGDKFRDMKRRHQHQLERTQRWEEALVSVPDIRGMPRAEQRVNGRQDSKISGSYGRERKPKRSESSRRFHGSCKATSNRSKPSRNCYGSCKELRKRSNSSRRFYGLFHGSCKTIEIAHSENSQKWAWSFIDGSPNYTAVKVKKMIKVHWLKIVRTFDTRDLIPRIKYEAIFLLTLEDDAIGWEQRVTLKIKVEQHDRSDNLVDRTENLKEYMVNILAGDFVVPPGDMPAKITFTMFQYVTDDNEKGLVIKGVTLRPRN